MFFTNFFNYNFFLIGIHLVVWLACLAHIQLVSVSNLDLDEDKMGLLLSLSSE